MNSIDFLKIKTIKSNLNLLNKVRIELKRSKIDYTGLCSFIVNLYYLENITRNQFDQLKTYFKDNLPKKTYDGLNEVKCCYSFPIYCKESRIGWLKKEIEKLTKEIESYGN